MDLAHRGARDARRVAMLPAAWNPPTVAHLALAEAALNFADEVLLVLPRIFPHKGFEHAGFELRLEWLRRIAASRTGLGVGVTEGGLFLEMARALRAADARVEHVYIVCGRDAAERFLNWPYEHGPGASEQLREFSLLVAPRGKPFEPPDSGTEPRPSGSGCIERVGPLFDIRGSVLEAGEPALFIIGGERAPGHGETGAGGQAHDSHPLGVIDLPVIEGSVHALSVDPKLCGVSSTEVRRRIARGESWTDLVPDEIAAEAGGVYR
jgi:nicotinic acid mononucleotide adenylyltransferase